MAQMSLAEQLQAQQKIMREKAEAKAKLQGEGSAAAASVSKPAAPREPTLAE